MLTRRMFLHRGVAAGLAAATTPLWSTATSNRAFAQMSTSAYKAIVVITLEGGNDANNFIVPLDNADYAEYSSLRGSLALPASSLNVLNSSSNSPSYGLHPALVNVAKLYNNQRAAIVANVGPLTAPVTKAALVSGQNAYPDSLLDHTCGVKQWESASAYNGSLTGWGGRLADLLVNQSGSLPPALNGGVQSLFPVGQSVQAVAVQGGGAFAALPAGLQSAINAIAQGDQNSNNALVQQATKIRLASLQQQAVITEATAYRSLKTPFPTDGFGTTMQTMAQIIAGNAVIGANRQIFYTQQGSYDTHAVQLGTQEGCLQSLDAGLGAFFNALDEIGVSNQVLVCTHSDFNRTYTSNVNGGSDHAWGSHQLVMGGGIKGGRIIGSMPTLELNGPDDMNGEGIWIPKISVSQLAGGVGSWMGLSSSQLSTVLPELKNFPSGPIQFT